MLDGSGVIETGNLSFYLSNYSNSSKKLLEKVILLAGALEKRAILKYPNVNFDCWRKRRMILFSALTVISNKFGLGSKLLQFDWLIEILSQIICKIRLDFALKVIKIEGGMKKLWEDLRQARKLQFLQILRAALRNETKLKVKLLKEEAQTFLISIEKRKKNFAQIQQTQKNAKLQFELDNLRLEDPDDSRATLRKFLHIWRCFLNLRLVKSRTRKRFKSSVVGKWRKCTRVSTIAGIYYGKKVKLRLFNRWFSKRFGKEREHQLTLRLNDFVARRRRRSMFLKRGQVQQLTAKGLFQVWRDELQGRKAEIFYSARLLKSSFKKWTGILSLNQGRAQTSRLYNEIRLLKNFFYSWFSKVIPDRLAFARDRQFLAHKESRIKSGTFQKWSRKSRSIILLEQQSDQVQIAMKNRRIALQFSKWNSLTKQHAARLIWTENFRLTEDLRSNFGFWRSSTKNQIISDTKYQFNLCKTGLTLWRNLFEKVQEERFQLKRFFTLWKVSSQGRRGIRFLNGQLLLRRLTRFKATNLTLSRALEQSTANPETCEYSLKIVQLFKWKSELKRIKMIRDCGNSFLFEKLKKILQIWRLKTAELNVISSEPTRIKSKAISSIRKHLRDQRDKCDGLDRQLFHYYANRAIHLENIYFQRWESAFQVLQVGEHCCLQVLKLWEAQQRKNLFRRWQVQTAGIIFSKCKRITEQQGAFTKWRQLCRSERERRSLRIVSKYFQSWTQTNRQRKLENSEINFRHVRTKLSYFSKWKESRHEMIQSWSRASDFFYIVRGCKSLSLWRQKLEALLVARTKTQTLLLLRAPIVRKPRIEHLMAKAASLSNLPGAECSMMDKDEDGNLIIGNLNIAELSV